MYTQCSRCETVFELSAEVLRAAGGQVRCGNCGEVFNALLRLAEDSSLLTDEASTDLETRADRILESAAPPPADALDEDSDEPRPGVEIARLEVIDWPDEEPSQAEDDRSLEFSLPPGELDRVFVAFKKPLRLVEAAPAPPPPEAAPDALSEVAPQPERAASDSFLPPHRVSGFEIPDHVRRDMLQGFRRRVIPSTIEPAAGEIGRAHV